MSRWVDVSRILRPRATAIIAGVALLAGVAPAHAGTWAGPLSAQQLGALPAQDAKERTLVDLQAAMMGLYWGDFDGARSAKRVHRREDTLEAFSQYVGWVPYRALLFERAAIKLGLERVAGRLRTPNAPNYRCFGLERGGGFLVDVINHNAFLATQVNSINFNHKFQCASVDKDANRPVAGTDDVQVPNGDGTSTKRTQDKGKISDQTQLSNAMNGVNDGTDIVIVDTFVSGDSMMYTLETVARKLAASPTGSQRFVVLAIRDGARIRKGYMPGKIDGYSNDYSVIQELTYDQLGDSDMKGWREGSHAHLAGHDLANNLVRQYGDRFTMIVATAWYLVAEDVAFQLTKKTANQIPGNNNLKPLYIYAFLNANGQMLEPYIPNVTVPENVYVEVPAVVPTATVWTWTPAQNETYRSMLVELVARGTVTMLRGATVGNPPGNNGLLPGHP